MSIKNQDKKSYDIIILAGQSNAYGYGVGDVDKPYEPCERIKMLCGDFTAEARKVEYGDEFLDLKVGDEYYIETAKEKQDGGKTFGNLSLTFSKEYLANDAESERSLLIINTPIGGTGFAKGHWGKGEILCERMFKMVRQALEMNEDNKVVAFLWHQGEHDAFENAGLTVSQREEYYYNKFTELLTSVRGEFGRDVPVVCGKFSKVWAEEYKEKCEAVYRATEKVCEEQGRAMVVDTYDLTNSNDVTGNGDNIHFSRPALYELGKRYYKAYKQIKENK